MVGDPVSLVVARTGPRGRLGTLRMAGRIDGSRGAPPGRTVRFGFFGCTYLTRGAGRYRDATHDVALGPGSLVLVAPGHPHWYGVVGSGTWDERFLVFDGPAFELARSVGAFDVGRPVRRLLPVRAWAARLDRFRLRRPPRTPVQADAEVAELLALLADAEPDDEAAGEVGDWYGRSVERLAGDLGAPVALAAIAAEVGMPYETWRRRFRARAGTSPAAFRLGRRLDAATDLLTATSLSTREIAAALGFSDEQHLIRHFRAREGVTPRRYRDARR